MNNKNNILDQLMIFGAEYVIYLTFILIILLAFKGGVKERKALILAVLSLPVAVIIIKIIHLFLVEPRPFITYDITPLITHKEDASFPSRHTSLVFAVAFAYLFYKSKWASFFLALAIWVSLSRIYVGVHFPLDILGGIITAFISVLLSWKIKSRLQKRLGLD